MTSFNKWAKYSFRLCCMLLLISAVIAVIYFTPFPDLDAEPEPCDRKCHELDWPMICRMQLVLESKPTLPRHCRNCSHQVDHCRVQKCFKHSALGRIVTVNGKTDLHNIHVCANDIMLIDVINNIPDTALAFHWRGQSQRGHPLMDGVPMVTQCPIPSYTTFQYKFRASDAGTHMWQLYSAQGSSTDVKGLFVVRESDRKDPHRHLYDHDYSLFSFVLSVSNHGLRKRILVEGQRTIDQKYEVNRGERYRFRVAHGGRTECPVKGTLDHNVVIISLDGNPIKPVYTKSFVIAPGERVDFVFIADHNDNECLLRFEVTDHCDISYVTGTFITLVYNNTIQSEHRIKHRDMPYETAETVSTMYEDHCSDSLLCLNQLHSFQPITSELSADIVDSVIYLPFHYNFQNSTEGDVVLPSFSNISFLYPSSPLVDQRQEVQSEICNVDNMPVYCSQKNGYSCQCVHVIDVKLRSTVELVLSHHGECMKPDHTFHLHGNKFYVVARTRLDQPLSAEDVKTLDAKGLLLSRNLVDPVLKDTISIPDNGVAALRFLANNPGYWMLREISSGSLPGMEVVLRVGTEEDTPEIPEKFPSCGNFIGPKFFLT